MFLRIGEIPENEMSINWMKVKLDDQRDFDWALKPYGYDEAVKFIRNLDDVLEKGVSVFEIDECNNPILSNEKLRKSYESRKDRKMYLVNCDVVGIGQDGEPLLRNATIVKEL